MDNEGGLREVFCEEEGDGGVLGIDVRFGRITGALFREVLLIALTFVGRGTEDDVGRTAPFFMSVRRMMTREI